MVSICLASFFRLSPKMVTNMLFPLSEITYIVIKSEYRHHGIGKDLMDYVFNKARSAGVPVAVSAEPQIYEFFKKYGFHDTKHVDFDLAQWAPPHSGFGIFRLAGLIWHPWVEWYFLQFNWYSSWRRIYGTWHRRTSERWIVLLVTFL